MARWGRRRCFPPRRMDAGAPQSSPRDVTDGMSAVAPAKRLETASVVTIPLGQEVSQATGGVRALRRSVGPSVRRQSRDAIVEAVFDWVRDARCVRGAHDRVESGSARSRLPDRLSRRYGGLYRRQRDRAAGRHLDPERSLPGRDMVPLALMRCGCDDSLTRTCLRAAVAVSTIGMFACQAQTTSALSRRVLERRDPVPAATHEPSFPNLLRSMRPPLPVPRDYGVDRKQPGNG